MHGQYWSFRGFSRERAVQVGVDQRSMLRASSSSAMSSSVP